MAAQPHYPNEQVMEVLGGYHRTESTTILPNEARTPRFITIRPILYTF